MDRIHVLSPGYISINSKNSTVDCPGCLEITSLLANLDFVHVTLRAVPKADPFIRWPSSCSSGRGGNLTHFAILYFTNTLI